MGAKKFKDHHLKIKLASKGRKAGYSFFKLLAPETYAFCTKYTESLAKTRAELKKARQGTVDIGTPAFNKLPMKPLLKDMEKRFKDG